MRKLIMFVLIVPVVFGVGLAAGVGMITMIRKPIDMPTVAAIPTVENVRCVELHGTLTAMGYSPNEATFVPMCSRLHELGSANVFDCTMLEMLVGTPTPGFAKCVEVPK